MPLSFTRTLRLKVRPDAYAWLNAADRNRRAEAKFLTGFDLNNLSAGASEYFEHIVSPSVSGNESSPHALATSRASAPAQVR